MEIINNTWLNKAKRSYGKTSRLIKKAISIYFVPIANTIL